MPLPIDIQSSILAYSFLSGLLTGGLFDLYRIIRGDKVPKVIATIEDILFGILAALVVFTFLLYTDYAFLGPYVYISMIIAMIIYIKFISPVFIKLENNIIQFIIKGFRVIYKHFSYIIRLFIYTIMGKNR